MYNEDSKKITVFIPSSSVDIRFKNSNGESKAELQDGLYAILGHDKSFNPNLYLYDNDGILRVEIPF